MINGEPQPGHTYMYSWVILEKLKELGLLKTLPQRMFALNKDHLKIK
jgi:hypothetical protein